MESEIGGRIREARERRGLNQEELARGARLTPGAVSRIEAGKRVPGSATVARLAGVLGVDSGHLLSGAGPARVAQVPQSTRQTDGHVVQAMQLIAQAMPNLPPNGRARVLRIIEAALG